MTPTMITRAREFRDAYTELLAAWRADEAPTLDQATAICYKAYRSEYNFLVELIEGATGRSNQNRMLGYFVSQLAPVLAPELCQPGPPEWRPGVEDVPGGHDNEMQIVVRNMLSEGVMIGRAWIDNNNRESPVTIGRISQTLDWLGKWVESAKEARAESPESPGADTEVPEDNTRGIPRSQSIALLYAVFVRLGITQTYTDTAIARLIEAVTGGKIRDGKNSYAWKHRNDKLQSDVEALFDEFMNGAQSPR